MALQPKEPGERAAFLSRADLMCPQQTQDQGQAFLSQKTGTVSLLKRVPWDTSVLHKDIRSVYLTT